MTIDEFDALWLNYWTDLLAVATADAEAHRGVDVARYLEAETVRARIVRARECAERCAERHV